MKDLVCELGTFEGTFRKAGGVRPRLGWSMSLSHFAIDVHSRPVEAEPVSSSIIQRVGILSAYEISL